jgi:hypothetical protein
MKRRLRKRYGRTAYPFGFVVGQRVRVTRGPWARHVGEIKMMQGPEHIYVRLDPTADSKYGLGSTHAFELDRLELE